MSPRRVAGFIALVAGFMVATWLGGWWTVPIVAGVAGLMRLQPKWIALAASVAWLVLLGADAVVGGEAFGRLVGLLSGILRVPALLTAMLAVVFPGALGWSAAVVGEWSVGLVKRPGVTGEPDNA